MMLQTRQRGSALIAVVWTVLLVSTLLAVALLNMRLESRFAIGRIESLKADAAARSGLAWAAFQYSKSSNHQFQDQFDLQFSDYELNIAIEKESGKVDVNKAPPNLLEALALSSGAQETEAQDFLASLLKARSGALSPKSSQNLPDNGDIKSPIVDVAQLYHLNPTVADCLLGDLTVYTGSSGIDTNSASSLVKEAQKRLGHETDFRRSRRSANTYLGAATLTVAVSREGTPISRVSRVVRVTPRSGLSSITQADLSSLDTDKSCDATVVKRP